MLPTKVAIENIRFYMRNVRTRLPFKYGKAVLLGMPILHVRLRAAGEDGRKVEGYSADCLPPKWFDKDPAKDYRANIEDLLRAIRIGEGTYREQASGLGSVFSHWMNAYTRVVDRCKASQLNGLSASFASSLMERALLDAGCKLAGMGYRDWVYDGGLGLDPGAVHGELKGIRVESIRSDRGNGSLYVRHTIGLADPIWTEEIPPHDRLRDGLPQSVEEWIPEAGLRYFKVKISGDIEADGARLSNLAGLLDERLLGRYHITLDGNEVFPSFEAFKAWFGSIQEKPSLRRFWSNLLVLEQPIERHRALDLDGREVLRGIQNVCKVIIDESDDSLDSFKRAKELGYRGVSVKNCKGPIKGILNWLLVKALNHSWGSDVKYSLTAEDLANLPVVPLQQDLAQIDLMGLTHAERNGHHFFHGLDHLAPTELQDCLSSHSDLYEPIGKSGRLRIRDGRIQLTSLRQEGFGACGTPAFDSMIPLGDWVFESLGIQ